MKINDYHDRAFIMALISHDIETQVGCVLISRETKQIIGVGSNQFIAESLKFKLPNTRPNKYFYIQHAEAKMIYEMAKYGKKSDNSILVCTHSPCIQCMRLLLQSGIDTIYFKTFRPDSDIVNYVLDIKANLRKLKSGFYKMKLSIRK